MLLVCLEKSEVLLLTFSESGIMITEFFSVSLVSSCIGLESVIIIPLFLPLLMERK